ncbi:hypothetical protein ACS0TY_010926 [Phlomoides rotata]
MKLYFLSNNIQSSRFFGIDTQQPAGLQDRPKSWTKVGDRNGEDISCRLGPEAKVGDRNREDISCRLGPEAPYARYTLQTTQLCVPISHRDANIQSRAPELRPISQITLRNHLMLLQAT